MLNAYSIYGITNVLSDKLGFQMSDINIWQIESLRTTVFPIGQAEYNPDWWKSITGDDPEAFSAKPKENMYRGRA